MRGCMERVIRGYSPISTTPARRITYGDGVLTHFDEDDDVEGFNEPDDYQSHCRVNAWITAERLD